MNKNIRTIRVILIALLSLAVATGGLWMNGTTMAGPAAPEGATTSIPYQGRLNGDSGQPVAGGSYDFTFEIYDAQSGGAPLWTETQTGVTVRDGYFSVLLGSLNPLGAEAASGEHYLAVSVQGPGDNGSTALDPRQSLDSFLLPQQTGCGVGVSADHDHWGETWSGSSTGLILSSSDGYGFRAETSATADYYAAVRGYAKGTTGRTYGVYGNTDSTHSYSRGVFGYASAGGVGVWGESPDGPGTRGRSTNSYGVWGKSDNSYGILGETMATTSTVYGVYGKSYSTAGGGGVYGYASAASGQALGVRGQTDSSSDGARGVLGWATAATGVTEGVRGQTASSTNSARGVWGHATATSGETYGVYGTSNSPDGYGVYGKAPQNGVYGISTSSGSETAGVHGVGDVAASGHQAVPIGVWGESQDGIGVWGNSTNAYAVFGTSANSYGVRGVSSSSDAAGVFATNYGSDSAPDLVLGGASSSDDNGTLYSDPNYSGSDLFFYSNDDINIRLDFNDDEDGVFNVYNSDASAYLRWEENGNLTATGSKSAVVQTEDYGWRHLYAVESPGNWFEDFGQAQLVDGQAIVTIEPIFAQTVNLTEDYHIFLTPLGDCALYVAEKTPATVTVQAMGGQTCSVAFDYRIVAKRLGYESERLEPAVDPATMALEMAGEDDIETGQ